MNTPAVALAALTLTAALAAAAQAAPQQGFATDVDYLRASRCRGIAEGVGADGAAISAYLKQQSLGRASYILDRGQDERDRAKRQAKGYAKPQLRPNSPPPARPTARRSAPSPPTRRPTARADPTTLPSPDLTRARPPTGAPFFRFRTGLGTDLCHGAFSAPGLGSRLGRRRFADGALETR